jgi:hypothetical protein
MEYGGIFAPKNSSSFKVLQFMRRILGVVYADVGEVICLSRLGLSFYAEFI